MPRLGHVICALLAGGAAACGATGAPPPAIKGQGGWRISATRPDIPAGAMRARALWNDPSVVRTPGGYAMYLTTSTGEPFKPPVLPFRAVSVDGRRWRLDPARPLLNPVAPYASIETPSVVRFAGRWHMFFTGIYSDPDPSPMAIGHAVSDDGIRWTIDRPVLIRATGKATDWNSYLVGEPGAVVVGGELRVYFSAVGARQGAGPPQDQSIGVITTTDGRSYSSQRRAFSQSRQFSGARGFAGYSSPAAVVIGRDVHLFYSVAHFQPGANPEWRQVAIAEAVSAGGTAPFVERAAPVVALSSTRWAGGEVIGPAPLVEGDRLRLWFGGHVAVAALAPLIRRNFAGPEFGIGLAERTPAAGRRPVSANPVASVKPVTPVNKGKLQ